MATWADIQNWDHAYVIEAENLIEDELREARDIVADLEFASKDIRSVGKAPDEMRNRLSKIQKGLDSRINELTEYALATAELHGYVSRVVAKRESAWEVAAEIGAEITESGFVKWNIPEREKTSVKVDKYDELCVTAAEAIKIATEAEDTVGPRYKALADGQYATRSPRAWLMPRTSRGAPRRSPYGGRSCRSPSARRSSTGTPKSTATSMVSTWRREQRRTISC